MIRVSAVVGGMPQSLAGRAGRNLARAVWAAALLFSVIGADSAFAAKRVALLIGNNEYLESRAKLVNAANDAEDLAAVLKDKLGFDVILLKNATARMTRDAVANFADRLQPDDIALFFYAGHAVQLQGSNYILPVDASLKSSRDVVMYDGVDVSKLVRNIMDRAKLRIVILDACRDNPFKDSFNATAGLAQMDAPPNSLLAYSTGLGQVANDGTGRNGMYTKYLLRQIAEPGLKINEAFEKVGAAVQKETANAKMPGTQQVPWVLSSLIGAPVLVEKIEPKLATGVSEDELLFWKTVRLDNTRDLDSYLKRYPNGNYAALAQARLDDLSKAQAAAPSTAPLALADPPKNARSTVNTPAGRDAAPPGPESAPLRSEAALPRAEATPAKSEAAPTTLPGYGAAATPATQPAPVHAAKAQAPAAQTQEPAVAPQASERPTKASDLVAAASAAEPAAKPPAATTAAKGSVAAPPAPPVVIASAKTASPGGERPGSVIRYSDGSTYTGTLRDGFPHGTGEYKAPDGTFFIGEFANGKRSNGHMRWANGNEYVGTFKEEMPYGKGVLKFATGVVCDCDFINGIPNGKGNIRYTNGDVYDGEVAAGKYEGHGTLRLGNGETYRGEFHDQAFNGQGEYLQASGDRYVGLFKDGKANGQGALTLPDGLIFEGVFENGTDKAKGVLVRKSGERQPAEIVGKEIRLVQ